MKKLVSVIVIVAIFCTTSLSLLSCGITEQESTKHDVVLVLVEQNGNKTRKILTSLENGETLERPEYYENYSSLIQGYVRVRDDYIYINGPSWYFDDNFEDIVNFTSYTTMPDKDVELYTPVQLLTDMNEIELKNLDKVENVFSSSGELQGYFCSNIPDGADESLYVKFYEGCYFKKPDINDDKCYYEIVKDELSNARYYPVSKMLKIRRTYRQPTAVGGLDVFEEYFTIITEFDYANNSIVFMGEYIRTGAGKISIVYNIEGLGLENDKNPIPPNPNTVSYSYEIIEATNITKMKELWISDGNKYATLCYRQSYYALSFMYNYYGILIFEAQNAK